MYKQWIDFKLNHIEQQMTVRKYLEQFFIAHKKLYILEMNQAIKINDQVAKLEDAINNGDVLSVDQTSIKNDDVKPSEGDIDIVYEDEDLLVLNKPRKCLVYSDGKDYDTLTNRIAYHFDTYYPILPVHRIDYDTTGLVVFAKHPMIQSYMSKLFETDDIEKTYVCLVENPLLKEKGMIKQPIANDRHDNKMRVSANGKKALTYYEKIEEVGQYTKLRVVIHGGKKHQIRVHLRSMGNPIVSDPLYGHINLEYPNLMLHFENIQFIHPRTKKTINILKYADF